MAFNFLAQRIGDIRAGNNHYALTVLSHLHDEGTNLSDTPLISAVDKEVVWNGWIKHWADTFKHTFIEPNKREFPDGNVDLNRLIETDRMISRQLTRFSYNAHHVTYDNLGSANK